MDLDVVFLGTAGSAPTAQRGLTSALIRRGGHRILVDCGEGTQRQMMRSTGLAELDAILITHGHADHFLGLPGMLKTFTLRERETPLAIVGPRGFHRLWALLQPLVGRLSYEVEVEEASDGWQLPGDGYVLEAFETDHTVRSTGFRLREHDRPGRFDVEAARALGVPGGPLFGQLQRGSSVELPDGTVVTPEMVVGEPRHGRTIVFTGDTRACASVREAARDATLLVHEATFAAEEQQRAVETGHSTAHDAALTAVAANAAMLAITHLSNRYTGRQLLAEAREVFPAAVCPRDFDLIEVPFPERGTPRLVAGGGRTHVPSRRSDTAASTGTGTSNGRAARR